MYLMEGRKLLDAYVFDRRLETIVGNLVFPWIFDISFIHTWS